MQLGKRKKFTSEFDNLFDIAHAQVDYMINDEQKAFLSKQREKGRIGYISNICTVHDGTEELARNYDGGDDSPRPHKRRKQEKSPFTQAKQSPAILSLASSQESALSHESATTSNFSYVPSEEEPSESRTSRGSISVMTKSWLRFWINAKSVTEMAFIE
ncbi:uncharacterized protein LOC124178625 [Neodiprion fabricii]|uniref:uncharacterized protein LOC124178625 n=1 Tax=Neodiprion fabricii TaxID=2872261 RepID=UPI001ED8E5EB|nr:uncharacterized protein LOC124178625 [Neodiprion fabricii]